MEKVIVYNSPVTPVAEAYRILCTNVLAGKGEKKLIEVIGIVNDSGACLVTANLATAMAQAGKKVLLIDCNLRNPKQHDIFVLQNRGLTECLSAVQNYCNFVQQTSQCNLDVLTAGTVVENPVETLLSPPMQELLNTVRSAYDIVLLDVPAVNRVADAVALGTKTDGAILVLTNKRDKVEQAQKAKEVLTQAGVAILGCVLDKAVVS